MKPMGTEKAMCAQEEKTLAKAVTKPIIKGLLLLSALLAPSFVFAVGGPKPVERDYVTAANAPASQSPELDRKSVV